MARTSRVTAFLVSMVALVSAWPAVRALLQGGVPGQAAGASAGEGPVDGVHTVFYYAVAARRLSGEGVLARVHELWHPLGRPLLLAQQNVVDALLAAPLVGALGPARGTSLALAGFLATNALAGAWLARQVAGDPSDGRDHGLAQVAGALALGLSPFVLDELRFGRYTQVWVAPTALAVGAAWRALAPGRPGASPVVLAGLALALCGYHYWFYGLFAAVVIGALGLAHGMRGVRVALGVGAVAAVLVAPFVLYVAFGWGEVPAAGVRPPFAPATRLLGGLPGAEPGVYLPQGLLLAGLLGLYGAPRAAAGALVAAGWLLALALGEYVRVGETWLATPYHYLLRLPFLDRFWWPQRALGAATVAVVVAIALALRAGAHHPRVARAGVAVAVMVATAQALASPGWPAAWTPAPVPRWNAELPPGAVLEVPMLSPRDGILALSRWPAHGRPLVNGMSMWTPELWPEAFRARAAEDPLLRALLAAEQGQPGLARVDAGAAAGLARSGVVGIVASQDNLSLSERAVLESALGAPRCADHACWWALPAPAGEAR